MEKGQINVAGNSIKLNKFKEYLPQKANRISIWPFLLSIFIYISIFYIFNLSPSTLFNTPRFWFFISNTLILIIAVDSGAFSSTKDQEYLFEEYVKHSRASSSFSSFELQYYCNNVVKKSTNYIPQQEVENSEEKKEIIFVHKNEFQENKLEISVENADHSEKPSVSLQEEKPGITRKADNEADDQVEKKNEGRYVRSKSKKAIPVTNNIENKIILRRSETEKYEENEEENEFSTMSDEELNRRVEEFIQRFNRQIRLQAAARNFRQI